MENPDKRMVAREYAFELLAVNAEMEANMLDWATRAQLDYMCYPRPDSERFILVFARSGRNTKLMLDRGRGTVRRYLGIEYHPVRIVAGRPFIRSLLIQTNNRRIPDPVWQSGERYSRPQLERGLMQAPRILDPKNRLSDLVIDGSLKPQDVPSIQHAREIIRNQEDDAAFSDRPDLDGPLQLIYRLHDDEGNPVEDAEPITVTIEGKPNQIACKRKHWWIYSERGLFALTVFGSCFLKIL
jgi:hypothetical protein